MATVTAFPVVLLLGPDRAAISGVSTHINLLYDSSLAWHYRLRHFRVGSEGREEGRIERLVRLIVSPFALALTLVGERVDVMHLNTSLNRRAYWRDLAYMIVARILGVRVIYQIHGGQLPLEFTGGRWLASRFLRLTLRLPEAIVVLAKRELEAYLRFVPNQAVHLMPNAIDTQPLAKLPEKPADARPGLQLLYLGRLARDKGLYETLHGLRLARLRGIDAHLVIAGNGPEEAGLKRAVSELQLEKDVHFFGPAFGADKLRLLGESDVLLLPSYAEGLPYALLEGMGAGLPVIATPVGAIPDVMSETRHGLFVPPRDTHAIARAIARLAVDPEGRERMGATARQRIASAYSIRRLASDLATLYAGSPERRKSANGATQRS